LENVQPKSITDAAGVGDARFDGAVIGANSSIQPGETALFAIPRFKPSDGVRGVVMSSWAR